MTGEFWTVVPNHPYFDGRDPWVEHREETWRFDLLDLNDKLIGSLDGVEEASFEFNVNQTIRSSGSLTWVRPQQGGPSLEWTQLRVQPWYLLRAPGTGEVVAEYPIGVFLPSFPTRQLSSIGAKIEIDLHDKLLILDQDKTAEAYTANSGELVTTLIRQLLLNAGQTSLNMDESTDILRSNMTWDAGTSWLSIINDVLDAAGYFSLGVDGYGTYQAMKYVEPAQRGVDRAFLDNAESIYDDELGHDEDLFDVPNRVVAISTADGETEALVAVHSDTTSGRFSIPTRGRVIVHVEEGVETTSLSALRTHAQRRLIELQQVTSSFDVNHAVVPLNLNGLVQLRNQQHNIDAYAVVQSFTFSTEVGGLQQTRLREVRTV